jgi:hypothetical protein
MTYSFDAKNEGPLTNEATPLTETPRTCGPEWIDECFTQALAVLRTDPEKTHSDLRPGLASDDLVVDRDQMRRSELAERTRERDEARLDSMENDTDLNSLMRFCVDSLGMPLPERFTCWSLFKWIEEEFARLRSREMTEERIVAVARSVRKSMNDAMNHPDGLADVDLETFIAEAIREAVK